MAQIGDRLYIDLEIPALDKKGFLEPTDVYALEIIETAGTSLPMVVMTFKTYDKEVKDAILENNKVIVKLGETDKHADSFSVTIYNKNKPSSSAGSNGGTGWVISFGGFINGNVYMFNNENKTYDGNSLMVAKQVIKDSFGKNIKTSIKKTNENQVTWRQNNQTACSFLVETLMHMDIMPSFPIFSFDKFGNFRLKSFNEVCKGSAAFTFVNGTPRKASEIPFYNNFSPDDYRNSYNLYSGYDRVTEITDSASGKTSSSFTDNAPMLAASKIAEKSRTGSKVTTNKLQSTNVHKTYNEAFAYNTSKLLALSTLSGTVELRGRYYRELAPLDLVNLNAGDSQDAEALNGLWLIEAISTHANFTTGCIETSVAIARDNYNYIENHVEDENIFKVLKKWMNKISAAIHDFKVAYAQLLRIMDGTFLNEMMGFMTATKTNLLRSFSVLGTTIDFNSSANLIKSMVLLGNSLMNTLVDMVFPEVVANLLRDFIIVKPSLMNLVSNFIVEYVPYDLRDVISMLFNSLFNVTDSLNSIAKDNGITVTTSTTQVEGAELSTTETSEIDYTANGQERVSGIIEDFENNTTGLDIPYPLIELSESQSLMSDKDLTNYIATMTIENLTNLGYLTTDEEGEELKEILIGNQPINFNLIDAIKKNAGNTYSYRFWGTFGADNGALYAWRYEDNIIYTKTEEIVEKTRLYNSDYSPYARIEFQVEESGDSYIITYNGEPTERYTDADVISNALTELTSFVIKKSYKDRYRTIPCTKIISASGNRRIYFACPQSEIGLKFYVNAKRVELNSFPIDLGYLDIYGNKMMYNVYYTDTGYNSNSVMLEVKKGGMV